MSKSSIEIFHVEFFGLSITAANSQRSEHRSQTEVQRDSIHVATQCQGARKPVSYKHDVLTADSIAIDGELKGDTQSFSGQKALEGNRQT